MNQQLNHVIFNTDLGWVGILGSTSGVVRVTLPRPSSQEVRHSLGNTISRSTPAPHLFQNLMNRLTAYFSGHKIDFPDQLDLSGATSFQQEVWGKTRLIPFGETRSYGWVARQVNKPKAPRAVGQALGKNPFPIIVPCHRVLAHDGKLGGFTGGLDMKRQLLGLETQTDT